jgi:hypothetical protein
VDGIYDDARRTKSILNNLGINTPSPKASAKTISPSKHNLPELEEMAVTGVGKKQPPSAYNFSRSSKAFSTPPKNLTNRPVSQLEIHSTPIEVTKRPSTASSTTSSVMRALKKDKQKKELTSSWQKSIDHHNQIQEIFKQEQQDERERLQYEQEISEKQLKEQKYKKKEKDVLDMLHNRKEAEKVKDELRRPVSPVQMSAQMAYNKYLKSQQGKKQRAEELRQQVEEKKKAEREEKLANQEVLSTSLTNIDPYFNKVSFSPVDTSPMFSVQVTKGSSACSMDTKELEKLMRMEKIKKQQQHAKLLAEQIKQKSEIRKAEEESVCSSTATSIPLKGDEKEFRKQSRDIARKNQEVNKRILSDKEGEALKEREKERLESEAQLRKYLDLLQREQLKIEQEKRQTEKLARHELEKQVKLRTEHERQYFQLDGNSKDYKQSFHLTNKNRTY